MTALGSSSDVAMPRRSAAEPAAGVGPTAFPGRWVGGAIGVVATVLVGGSLWVATRLTPDLDLGFGILICALGIPIAFVVGRHLGPTARDGGVGSAFWAALTFGLIAPVLGDIEIVGGSLLVPWLTHQTGPEVVAGDLVIGIFGLLFCFVAAPITIVVGLVWVVLMRTMPIGDTSRFRAPTWLEGLGVRHAVLALVVCVAIVQIVWAFVHPANPVPEW
jgi:hypothetical protein